MESIPREMYNSMTGNTARAFLVGGTAAEMNGMDAQLDQLTAASARMVRYTLLPKNQGARRTQSKSDSSR